MVNIPARMIKHKLNTSMMRFRKFMEDDMSGEKLDIQTTLSQLPPGHAALVQGFKWRFHAGNTLNGDEEHVGYVDDASKEIAVAAPWNYGREFTILHEVAHKVWEKFVAPNPRLVQQWYAIVQKMTPEQQNDDSLRQEPEELFCMAYAQRYTKNKIEKFKNHLWERFIDQIPS